MVKSTVVIERGEPDVAVVLMCGEHDAYRAPQLESRLTALLDEDLCVLIDLSGATFLDSVTLFVLIRARRHAAVRGLGFALQLGDEAGKHVHRAFELTRLSTVFSIGTTRATALAEARLPVQLEPT
jgi:anti-anti-sigma factor